MTINNNSNKKRKEDDKTSIPQAYIWLFKRGYLTRCTLSLVLLHLPRKFHKRCCARRHCVVAMCERINKNNNNTGRTTTFYDLLEYTLGYFLQRFGYSLTRKKETKLWTVSLPQSLSTWLLDIFMSAFLYSCGHVNFPLTMAHLPPSTHTNTTTDAHMFHKFGCIQR